jgi:hypothetical protein
MSALEFQINLAGNFTGAIGESAKATEKHEHATEKARKELELFDAELGHAQASAGGFGFNLSALAKGGSLFTFDLAEGAELVAESFKKALEVITDVGKEMVKVAGDTQDLDLSIKLDVGTEGLEKVSELGESFLGTRFSPKLIKESLLPLLEESGDDHQEQWDDLVTAATDVATRRKTGAAGAKGALEALRGIEIQPQKIRGALKELGIKQLDFYNDLGDLLGISEQAAEKQVKAGKVKAQTLLSVALHQIAQREGGELGTATNEGAKTLGTTLDRLANLKDNLFERVADSPGMHAIQRVLDNFIDTMEGPIGTELVNKLSDAFTTLFGDVSGPDGLEKMKDTLADAVHLVGEMIDAGKQLADALLPSLDTVQDLVIGLRQFVALSSGDKAGFQEAINEEVRVHADRVVRGFQRMNEMRARFAEQNALNDTGPTAFQSGGGVEDTASGMSVPQYAAGGIVTKPTLALIGEAGPEAVVPLSDAFGEDAFDMTGGRGGNVYHINFGDIIVEGGGHDGAELGVEVSQAVRRELSRFFDEVNA